MLKILRIVRNMINWMIDLIYPFFRRFIPPETFRYAVTGGMNTVFDIFLYFVFYNFILNKQALEFGIFEIKPHVAAFLIVFPITFSTGFLLAKYITFTQSTIRGKVQLFRYALSVSGSIVLNYILLRFFVEYLYFWPTAAKIVTTIIVIIYSYMIQRFYTFKTANRTTS